MPKLRTKHHKNSHKVGEMVEFIGKDKKQRGIGIVLEEISFYEDPNDSSKINSYTDVSGVNKKKLVYSHCRVYWVVLKKEEIVHKAFLKRCVQVSSVLDESNEK